MPRLLPQNRNQFFAQQTRIAAQVAAQFQNQQQISQSVATTGRQAQDQLTSIHQRDVTVQEKRQTTDYLLQVKSSLRIASNDKQADKMVANQQDFSAYLSAQFQRKSMTTTMDLGYA